MNGEDKNKVSITLASASPRRRELLDQIQVNYYVHAVNIDETPVKGESPLHYVERLAQAKAHAAYKDYPFRPSLGSDTAVVYQNKILGKPENEQHALEMLRLLSGQTHRVMTAVAICAGDFVRCVTKVSEVEFSVISDQQINAYWQTTEPIDKAGGYAIQGIAAQFIKNINGSYSGVMGLPLYETCGLLKLAGIDNFIANH